MGRVSIRNTEALSDKALSIGIDIHEKNWHVTVRTEGGEIPNGRIPGNYHSSQKILERFTGCQIKVAYEAGPFGFWLYDTLNRRWYRNNRGFSLCPLMSESGASSRFITVSTASVRRRLRASARGGNNHPFSWQA